MQNVECLYCLATVVLQKIVFKFFLFLFVHLFSVCSLCQGSLECYCFLLDNQQLLKAHFLGFSNKIIVLLDLLVLVQLTRDEFSLLQFV